MHGSEMQWSIQNERLTRQQHHLRRLGKGLRIPTHASLGSGWQALPSRETWPGQSEHAAIMGIHRRGGTVFAAGTADSVQAPTQEAAVASITCNVLDGVPHHTGVDGNMP